MKATGHATDASTHSQEGRGRMVVSGQGAER